MWRNRNPEPPLNDPHNKFNAELAAKLTHEEVAAQLLAHDWKFARTMPQWPHEYTLRKNWNGSIPFENVVQFLRDHGRHARWGKARAKRIYWDHDGYEYWSMGASLSETTLINRGRHEDSSTFGKP
ncbi:MAG: hypothetical protein JNJ73_04600 [Hyphomonadaceae bacterium]|nr:hypothetical protein [Hyphomonadaceae bacterium]